VSWIGYAAAALAGAIVGFVGALYLLAQFQASLAPIFHEPPKGK
jgi:hypothetical protein